MICPQSGFVSYWIKADPETGESLRLIVIVPFVFAWVLFLLLLFFSSVFFSFLFCGQLLQNCQADLPEIFSHDTSTSGLVTPIFQILIRIMDHDPDHFKGFQKNLRISETTQRIFNIFISNESSH